MKVLRTPDERFTDLPDFPFAPHYVTVPHDGAPDGLRVHYLDEGPRDAAPVLLVHGEPSWSFLYRFMIPTLVAAGHRVVAPDLVGFGRSDKPADRADHTYANHVAWMHAALFDALDLRDITFFGQDWGGLIGLRLVTAQPDRFARLVLSNTGLPTGERPPTEAFLAWQEFSQTTAVFPVGVIVNGGTGRTLSAAEVAAYDAPFPDDSYTAGARVLPSLVPTSTADPAHRDQVAAWDVLSRFDRPVLCAFSDGDPVTRGGERVFLRDVPGTAGQPHTTVPGGHFVQEDSGRELAELICRFIDAG
ncbi:MAG: haloalkane dehalogenase [Ilumatobacteraceae bacterium]